ncbi:MAG: NAD(P)-dependent dehydrogenase (short-subunit alcohol dehydrogenase family) [Gammaproteobacteria bacterium]|jgi:NAD(P)-dependent dehydrogenase (short-subunit alcohol dehydrogenase family)
MHAYRESDVPVQTGKTILVTGANTGIGYETARVLAERGARVLLGCRSEEKAERAISRIKSIKSDANVTWVPLDLANLKSIKEAAAIVNEEERLDVLINNAGVMTPPKLATDDGFELQFGVNHLGHFALTGHLIRKLKDRPGARIVTLSSLAHRGVFPFLPQVLSGSIEWDDVHAHKKYNRLIRYNMSKFANILFTYELQRKLEHAGSSAISVAAHPGICLTELLRYIPRSLVFISTPLMRALNFPPEGALPTLLAATGQDVHGGDYYGPTRMGELKYSAHKVDAASAAKNEGQAKKLWDLSTELTSVEYAL